MKSYETFKNEIKNRGFTCFNESLLNVLKEDREKFSNHYFSDLESDIPLVHANRERARDVFKYCRKISDIELEDSENISIVDKNYDGARNYKKISMIDNGLCSFIVREFLKLIPVEEQKQSGLVGINLFRTFDVITQTRHKDYVDYVLIYCLKKNGKEAVTQLTKDENGKDIVAEISLEEGQMLLFKDSPFYHYTTPLIATDKNPLRDVIIMTIGV